MAIAYLGVGVMGGASAKFIAQPLTEAFGFRAGLIGIALLMLLTWPIVLLLLRDRPSDIGQYPDGDPAPADAAAPRPLPLSFGYLLRRPAFWLLLAGSFCSIGSIGAVNQHMKLIFLDQYRNAHIGGPEMQRMLNDMFSTALLYIGLISNAGRISLGYLADRFSKKGVMVITYFLVASSIPLLLRVDPNHTPLLFVVLFGLGMGADYMMIPLVAADQFGLASLARVMAIILPADTVAQACVPYFISQLRQHFGDYTHALIPAFGLALLGAIAVVLLPRPEPQKDAMLQEKLLARSDKFQSRPESI
jgi:MFS family permease